MTAARGEERIIDFGAAGKIVFRADLDLWRLDVELVVALRRSVDELHNLAETVRSEHPEPDPGDTPTLDTARINPVPARAAQDASVTVPRAITAHEPKRAPESTRASHPCPADGCDKTFASASGLSIHVGKKHPKGIEAPALVIVTPIQTVEEVCASEDREVPADHLLRCEGCDFTAPHDEYQDLYAHVEKSHQRIPRRSERRPRTADDLESELA